MSDSCNCSGGCCGGHDHSHSHDHGTSCGCGGHDHDHGCGCGCGGHDHDETPTPVYQNQPISDGQKTFLQQLAQCCYLPLARYVVKSTKEPDFMTQALGPAFIQGDHDSLEELHQVASFLQELYDFGLVTLDYDIPLEGYDYAPYYASPVFASLKEAVAEGMEKPGFWGDIAAIETGSMGLTEAAMDLLGNWL